MDFVIFCPWYYFKSSWHWEYVGWGSNPYYVLQNTFATWSNFHQFLFHFSYNLIQFFDLDSKNKRFTLHFDKKNTPPQQLMPLNNEARYGTPDSNFMLWKIKWLPCHHDYKLIKRNEIKMVVFVKLMVKQSTFIKIKSILKLASSCVH